MNGLTYIIVVAGILMAKGIGFLRDIVFASVFGASTYTDMYFQIFGLVNLIFTGVGVALSTLVIKNLNKTENSTEEKKQAYVSRFIGKTTLFTLLVTALMYIAAKPIVNVLLPGLDDEAMGTALTLMYIMLPSLLFVLVAYIISGVLQNNKIFFISSIMSLPFNVIIISSLFVPDIDIVTVGIVTTIGWFLHIVIQLPSFYKSGYRLFVKQKEKVIKSGRNSEIIWIFISNMMFQVCFMIDKAFVSGDSGAASTINYASNLFITIASVFVVAMSNVVFPSISKNYEEGNIDYVRSLLRTMIIIMLSIFVPFILVTSCFGTNVISLLYERGEFTSELAKTTGILFAVYTLGAFGYVCQELFNKILYLDGKYSYTVAGTIIVIALKPVINIFAVNYGVVAIAVTTTVLFTLYAISIALAIRKVTGNYIDRDFVKNILKIMFAGVSALAVFLMFRLVMPSVTGDRVLFLVPLSACGVVYISILWVSGIVKIILKSKNADIPQNEGAEK
ncbi:MAG: polysaccharide biosynthesis C-terminal domain-containing protein [Clostridia bacterium]|nr:polysaccharide biosynthesis C-terminal domain-containing protein [Clostridia bacterium]